MIWPSIAAILLRSERLNLGSLSFECSKLLRGEALQLAGFMLLENALDLVGVVGDSIANDILIIRVIFRDERVE